MTLEEMIERCDVIIETCSNNVIIENCSDKKLVQDHLELRKFLMELSRWRELGRKVKTSLKCAKKKESLTEYQKGVLYGLECLLDTINEDVKTN